MSTLIRSEIDLPNIQPDVQFGPAQALLTLVNDILGIIVVLSILAMATSFAAIIFKGFGSQWAREHAGKGFLFAFLGFIGFGALGSIMTFGLHIPLGL